MTTALPVSVDAAGLGVSEEALRLTRDSDVIDLHIDTFIPPRLWGRDPLVAHRRSPFAGRFFGHLAYGVEDIYETCEGLRVAGVVINRPPRDGRMAFVKSPDGHSIELLQLGEALPLQEPWVSMPNEGSW